jgi:toxin ParE1/3/4
MSWTVDFHPEARVEALEAEAWYAERDPSVAVTFTVELERTVDAIADAPLAWPPHGDGTRRRLLKKFPYSVVYRILADRLQVIAVAHQRRRPGYWRGR